MKKRSLLLVLLATLFVSCTGKQQISSVSVENSLPQSSQSEGPSTSTDTSTSERIYEDVDWSDETLANIQAIIGDVVLPYFKTREHESSLATDRDSGYRYVDIICKGANPNNAEEQYQEILKNAGYKITTKNDVIIAYQEVSDTDNVYVQFAINDQYDFEILVYQVTERVTQWPSEWIVAVCGYDVPAVPAKSYDLSIGIASNGNSDIYGYCVGIDSAIELKYTMLLESNGYVVDGSIGFYIAVNEAKNIEIWYYKYDENSLFIKMFSRDISTAFPSAEVEQIIGEELPVLVYEGAQYSKQDVTTSDGYTVYTIYCDYASENDLNDYRTLLLENDWEVTDSNDNESYISYVFTKSNDLGEHQIQIIYSVAQECIAIAIYY